MFIHDHFFEQQQLLQLFLWHSNKQVLWMGSDSSSSRELEYCIDGHSLYSEFYFNSAAAASVIFLLPLKAIFG